MELREFENQYRSALHSFLESTTEQNLERAYGVARKAIAMELGVLDVAAVFHKLLGEVLVKLPASKRAEKTVDRAMSFFHESLSPFEMTLRGFRENNERLHQSLQQLTHTQTELQSQNLQLSTARHRYREQFDFAPDGYLVTDLTGVIEEANVAAASLLHVEQRDLVGNSLAMYLEGDGQDLFGSQLLQLQSGTIERVRDWQQTIRPRKGRRFPAALTVGVVRDSSGKPAGLRWLVRDITHFKRAEAERSELVVRERVARAEAEAARRLAFLADASTLLAASLDSETTLKSVARLAVPFFADWCLVYIVDDDGSVRRVAVAQADPEKEELANALGRQVPPQVPEWVSRVLITAQSEIVPELTPGSGADADGPQNQIVEGIEARSALVVPLVARGRTLGAIALISIQARRTFGDAERILGEDLARRCAYAVDNARLHSEVIVQRDRAEKASRVKDEFLAILSHELRNPLVPILGWARILKARTSSDEVLTEGIKSLERNAQTIQRLVDDCLDLVRTSTRHIRIELSRIDLNSVVTSSIEAVVSLAREKGLAVDVELSVTPLWVIGDRTRLEQVVVNLLMNAIKYTPAGVVEVRSSRSPAQAMLRVKDTGIGIAPDFIEKVFEPFRQATSAWLTSDSGLGIGLSIAREIVALHSGRIWAESEGLRKGSTFCVVLPSSAEQTENDGPGDDELDRPEPPSVRPLRLLVVEDSGDILFLIKHELEWAGYTVFTANDGNSALAIAKQEVPDVIISDIKMPNLDGYQFLRELRAIPKLAEIPAIAMTGFGMERDIEQARAAGYRAHLVKPVNIDEMSRLIEQLANGTPP